VKIIQWAGGIFVPVFLSCGCSTMSNTDNGILGGGALGAATGAVIGHATGHTGAGALIGGAVGAVSGGLVGNAVDKSEEKQAAMVAAANGPRGPLGVTNIAQMAQAHVSDDVIVSQIRSTGSVFRLSPEDIIWLKQNGVSDPVVQEMQATATRYPAPSSAVYVVDPPPAPVYVGVGYYRYRRW
jgi:outer membrane lipoprotein SlyB